MQLKDKTKEKLIEMVEDLIKTNKILSDAINQALEDIQELANYIPKFEVQKVEATF